MVIPLSIAGKYIRSAKVICLSDTTLDLLVNASIFLELLPAINCYFPVKIKITAVTNKLTIDKGNNVFHPKFINWS